MARHDLHHAINKRKKEHWTESLGNTTNIEKATHYQDPGKGSSFAGIAPIKGKDGEVTQDKPRMAQELLASLFPCPRDAEQSDQARDTHRAMPQRGTRQS